MISELLEKLHPEDYIQLREAFEEEETMQKNVPGGKYWVGVNVGTDVITLAREGHYSYGEIK